MTDFWESWKSQLTDADLDEEQRRFLIAQMHSLLYALLELRCEQETWIWAQKFRDKEITLDQLIHRLGEASLIKIEARTRIERHHITWEWTPATTSGTTFILGPNGEVYTGSLTMERIRPSPPNGSST